MIANTPEHLEFFNGSITDLEACKTLEQLEMTRKAMTETRKGLKLSQAVTDELKRFIEVREAELRAGGAVA
jgi:hypothetical protein